MAQVAATAPDLVGSANEAMAETTATYNGEWESDDKGAAMINAVGDFFGSLGRDAARGCGKVVDAANTAIGMAADWGNEHIVQPVTNAATAVYETGVDIFNGVSNVAGKGLSGAWKFFTGIGSNIVNAYNEGVENGRALPDVPDEPSGTEAEGPEIG